jgi:hypothetical protein
MVRRRWLDDDDDLSAFDPKFLAKGKRVYRDGFGPKVHLMLTDSAPYARRPVFDARNHMPHEARLSDAARQRARCDDAYEAMCNRNEGAWTWNKPHVRAPVAVGDSPRDAWIRRSEDAWRTPTPRFDLDTTRSAGNTTLSPTPDDDEDNGSDIATDPYARNYWSSVKAIRSGSPDNAARVEAAQRRMSMSEPNATPASVTAENRRYRPRDAATAQAIRDAAYADYVSRLGVAWRQ